MENPKKYLFFDIETHRVLEWEELTPSIQSAFINHYYDSDAYENPKDHYSEIAGLHAEFSHVICVSFGYEGTSGEFHVNHICGLDEVDLLNKLTSVLDAFQKNGYALAGHNIFACDIPYLMKRYIINGIKVPPMLNHIGAKPWEVEDLDTMTFWKMGTYRATSLEMACACLGIPVKSEEISGANLWQYPIKEVPLDELAVYCDEDVVACYQLYKKAYEQLV